MRFLDSSVAFSPQRGSVRVLQPPHPQPIPVAPRIWSIDSPSAIRFSISSLETPKQ